MSLDEVQEQMQEEEMEEMRESQGGTGRAQQLEMRAEGGESGGRGWGSIAEIGRRVEEAVSPRRKGKAQSQSQAATTRKTSSVTAEPATQRLSEEDRHVAQNQQSLPRRGITRCGRCCC